MPILLCFGWCNLLSLSLGNYLVVFVVVVFAYLFKNLQISIFEQKVGSFWASYDALGGLVSQSLGCPVVPVVIFNVVE